MIFHVLPGDALLEEFRKTDIAGNVLIFREALVAGPIDADDPDEFWDDRARFVLSEYGEDEIDYHDKVAAEIERLTEIGQMDEVNLWFEYELFCSVNLWFCMAKLLNSEAQVFRIEPSILPFEKRWGGFGAMNVDDLKACFNKRSSLSKDDLRYGADLWEAFRNSDKSALQRLTSDRFLYLGEVIDAAVKMEQQPLELLEVIHSEGITDPDEVFGEFTKRAGVYGFGDLQVKRLWNERITG